MINHARKPCDEKQVRYGFYGRLSPDFPSQICVDVAEVCNLACIHCPHPEFKQSKYYSSKYLEPELNRKMVDEVREQGRGITRYIRYTSNGEPLIHPKGYEMIAYAVERSGTFVTLTTNGTIMNEKRTRRLLDSGIHMIDISIDAYTPETYARIRVGGDLDVTRTNVLRLLEWVKNSGAPTKVVVSYVEQPANQHETEDFKRYWEEQGADYVVIRRLHSAAGAVPQIARKMWESTNESERRPCPYPWERIILNPRGRLAFCPAEWEYKAEFADFATTTIKEAWQSNFMNSLRQAHLDNNFSCHSFCGQCPDWKAMRWPDEGRSYADMIEDFSSDEIRE